MDLESRKYKVIEKLLQVNEEETLYRIEAVLNDQPVNLWDELSPDVKMLIDKSLDESRAGNTKPNEEVLAEIRKRHNIA